MKKLAVFPLALFLALSFALAGCASPDGGETDPARLTELEENAVPVEIEPPEKPAYGFSFSLPDGWSYEIDQPEDGGYIAVCLRPEDAEGDGGIIIEYTERFGVCGTGLEEKEIDFNGYAAWQGFYDGDTMWDFISLQDDYYGCVILNGADSWYDDYEDAAAFLLSTVRFQYYE